MVINESGEIDLDHYLTETSQDAFLQMTFGCVCCTVRGDIRQTLLMLYERSMRGEIPTFARLIIMHCPGRRFCRVAMVDAPS